MKQAPNLQKRLILFAIITLIIPVGAIILTSISFVNSSGTKARQDQLISIMSNITNGIESYREKINLAAENMKDLEILQIKLQVYKKYWDNISVETRKTDVSLLKDELVKFAITGDFDNLSIYRRTNDRYVSIFTLGNSINLPGIVDDETIKLHGEKPFYSRNSEGLYLSEGLYVSVYKEIIMEGNKEGLLIVEKNFDHNYFTTQSIRFNTNLAVLVNGRNLYSSLPFDMSDDYLLKSFPSDYNFTETSSENRTFDIISQNFNLQDKIRGSLVIAKENESLPQNSASAVFPLLIIGFIGILIPLISFLIWNKNLIQSIINLVTATKEVSRGNYSHHISMKRTDEMGALSDAFNAMTLSLKENNDSLEKKNRQLNLMNNYIDAVFQSLNINTLVVDKNLQIVTANSSAKSELNIPEQIEGQSIYSVPFFKRNKETLQSLMKNILTDKQSEKVKELQSGEKVYDVDLFPAWNLEHEINGLVIIIADITNQIDMENALIKSGKLAAVGQVSAGIAHEIGNPMSIILNHVQLLQSGYLSKDEGTEYLDRIEGEVRRINNMIIKLLNFSKEENLKMQQLDMGILIDNVLALFMPKFKRKNVDTTFTNQSESALISGNRDTLKQVLYNILNNAVEAINHNKGLINIELTTENDFVIIEISDNGVGMDNETIERVFDPFYSNKSGSNTGLGLGLSEKIVKKHNGTISIRSTLGKGSHVILRFPALEVLINE